MTSGAASDARKSLRYAESLGVNEVYNNAKASQDKLKETLDLLVTARDNKRYLESQIVDHEMEVASVERGKHADMSAAAMDKHLKIAYSRDSKLKAMRAKMMEILTEIDQLESSKLSLEVSIRIAASRLQELGGYFTYLAVIKQVDEAEKHTKRIEAEREKDPWT